MAVKNITRILFLCLLCSCSRNLGVFLDTADIGNIEQKGTVRFNQAGDVYSISAEGENVWGTADHFFFTYKRVAGDISMEALVAWEGEGKNPHRKAGWMVRGGLESDAPYADAIVHGDGLISLQYRSEKGGETKEIAAQLRAPAKIRFERHGDVFSLSLSPGGKEYFPAGSLSLDLPDTAYAGLAICSHEKNYFETARVKEVLLEESGIFGEDERITESTLETVSIEDGERRIIHTAAEHFEAPNWSEDGSDMIFNSGGRLYTIPASGGEPKPLDTDFADRCNNDHGFSPDGRLLAVSHSPERNSLIYVLPAQGGTPRLVTQNGPSYWHGWSPDGKSLAYCASRGGEYDVYSIPARGGRESRLTDSPGLDDGPDYSPDGKYIYFNSVRSGVMQIWRMKPDGSGEERVTNDHNFADWFPHPSPDGKWIVFLSYEGSVNGHPPNKNVTLRIMPAAGGNPKIIASLFGGQGTINVPSWSPDSKHVAFVSYRPVGRKK